MTNETRHERAVRKNYNYMMSDHRDNPLIPTAIAAETAVDDSLVEAKPENKLK